MMIKRIYGGVIPDFKDDRGLWGKWLSIDSIQYQALSDNRWKGIVKRCKPGGSFQANNPTYIRSENLFGSYQEFVEWSQCQIGYSEVSYELDKDLLVKGNKIYSPETCVFIPSRVNTLIVKNDGIRGKFPVGVYVHKSGKFMAKCRSEDKKQVYLGLYNTPEEAFQAYKVYKESVIKLVAEEYRGVIDVRAYNALMSYTVEIDD